jgi:CDP-L-myo-inositol myo-inositolphosphotransferase
MLMGGFKANHASILTLLVGVAAAVLAAHPGYLPLIGSGVLFQLASTLDGVDGEMARSTLTESEGGALLDTVVDQITYVAFFVGVMVGWIREGAGVVALYSMVVVGVALVLSLMHGGWFVLRYAPTASFVFIDRAVRHAAHESGHAALRLAASMFTIMRRDAFAAIFFFVAIVGYRVLVPALIAPCIVIANVTLSRYRTELAAAALALGSRT